MDAGTHALASLALTRVVLPRAPLTAWGVVVVAGTIANVDALSAMMGPPVYLAWHHTYTHSIVASAAAGAILGIAYLLGIRESAPVGFSRGTFLSVVLAAGFLHLAMDACQSAGITALWPFSAKRVAADWLAWTDPWIITMLIAAVLLPEIARLVSDEIGAKNKGPRGRVGAAVGLAVVALYIGVRANFHGNAMATIEARVYQGESPRRAGAYPDSVSPFIWHCIVETERSLHEPTINTMPGASFDPDNGTTLFKPEASPILDRARNAETAKSFLGIARFPKASVEKTADGYEVQIRDLWYSVSGRVREEIVAVVRTNSKGGIVEDELVWARDLPQR